MIKLAAIRKTYRFGDRKTEVLKGVSVGFRKAEFVCVLGPSGCGKTTFLNIIGGLDRYDDGKLIIDGKSTEKFTEEDWDTYRSKTVGFVFQSYNLISHQTVLENVETALSIGGISKEERKKRAVEALCKVGLSEHLRKKPSQLSGGEMQRVAIARAIVNDPKMILADEPTGALDSKNSTLVMELLKEISKDRLVITVTHNAELAKAYATRTIEMKDGRILSDSSPYTEKEPEKIPEAEISSERGKNRRRHSFMSYSLAAKLSMKNLAGKKVRTILTSVAAAVSVLGIALVIACTNGLNSFVNKVQKDAMSALPVTVSNSAVSDYSAYIDSFLSGYFGSSSSENGVSGKKNGYVMINRTLKEAAERADATKNPISKEYIDYIAKNLDTTRASYTLEKRIRKNIYKTVNTPIYVAPQIKKPVNVFVPMSGSWTCLPENKKLFDEQYEILEGSYPENYNELMLVTDKNGAISDSVLAAYFIDIYAAIYDENSSDYKTGYSYGDITGTDLGKFHLVLNDDLYEKNALGTSFSSKKISLETYINKLDYVGEGNDSSKKWTDSAAGAGNRGNYVVSKFRELLGRDVVNSLKCYDKNPYETSGLKSIELKITCIAKFKDDAQCGMLFSPVCYNSSLNDYIIENSGKSQVVEAQKNSPNGNVVSDKDFASFTTLASALENLGYADLPTKINFYPDTINDKDYLLSVLDGYNEGKESGEQIRYVDNVGAVMEVVRVVVDGVTSILLVLTSVSLVVSAIMIGIITYVSVLERTKEIGVLRAVGARKKDVVRLFVTETGMIGLMAGALGLVMTFIAEIPLNAWMKAVTGIGSLALLEWWHVLAILGLSVVVTVAAGLIPSLMASKKDPVKALRSE